MISRKIYLLIPIFFLVVFQPTIKSVPDPRHPQVKAYFSDNQPIPKLSSEAEDIQVSATGVYVIDLNSGTVIYQKNPHKKHAPASLTKIMTSIVALDYYKEDTILKVVNAQRSLGNTIDLNKGDELFAVDVVHGLLIPSGNDAAVTLAENYPGGYKSFIDKMNQKVAELGLENTQFSNVSGVEGPAHYTTAHDISMIAINALERPLFKNIISQKNATFKSLKGTKYTVQSTNILLNKPGYFGVKTGWTPEAGECLVLLAERDSHPILITVLNSQDRFGEAEKITNWAYKNHTWQ